MIVGLDCVVSADTAVAHLSASLGVRTYLLLPSAANWRWGLGDRTPWYPTMHLIRQRNHGDWPAVVCELLRCLCQDAQRSDVPRQTSAHIGGPLLPVPEETERTPTRF